jgi:hypothetical protein
MAVELVDRLAILVGDRRRFIGMGAADSRSLCSDSYERMYHFVCQYTYVPLFRRLWGNVRETSCDVFLLLFMVLWVLIFAMLCKRAVPMLWHVTLFLELRPVGVSPPYFSFFDWLFPIIFL